MHVDRIISVFLKEFDRFTIMIRIQTPEEIIRRVRAQSNVFYTFLLKQRFYFYIQILPDSALTKLWINKDNIDPSAICFKTSFKIRKLSFYSVNKALYMIFLTYGNPCQFYIKILIKQCLLPKLLNINRIKDATFIPKIQNLIFVFLRIVFYKHTITILILIFQS